MSDHGDSSLSHIMLRQGAYPSVVWIEHEADNTMAVEDKSDEPRWTVIFGGVHACRPVDDVLELRTSINPVVTYQQIKDAQLQALWAVAAEPDVQAVMKQLADVLAPKLSKLGLAYGLQKGTISESQAQDLKKLKTLLE